MSACFEWDMLLPEMSKCSIRSKGCRTGVLAVVVHESEISEPAFRRSLTDIVEIFLVILASPSIRLRVPER
jgi:hypothetical protein